MAILSIIIPAYNEEQFIEELLQRVIAVDLHSLFYEKEIIVIDDGSTDHTAKKNRAFQQKHKSAIDFFFIQLTKEKVQQFAQVLLKQQAISF